MRKLIPILLLIFFAACAEKGGSDNVSSVNILENFSFTSDTVEIDVGEELFDPGRYFQQNINEDKSKAYYVYDENEIHEIDLNKLKLLARHVFETEGPNAMPEYINYMQVIDNEEVFFANYAQTGVYKMSGEKIISYKLQPDNVEGIPDDAGYSLTNSVHISPDKSTIISLPNTFGESIEGLAIIDAKEMSAKIKELPALELSSNFQIVFRQGNGSSATGDYQRIQFINDKFLIYSGATSEIYSYDWKSDSLQLHSFPHQLVPLTKTGEVTRSPESREAFQAAARELRKQISYGQFFWDETRESYFRFGNMNSQYNDEGRFVKSDIYLFSYDKDLKLTGEVKADGLSDMPYNSFMKDGKLYMYWIQGENPAFVIYTFDF